MSVFNNSLMPGNTISPMCFRFFKAFWHPVGKKPAGERAGKAHGSGNRPGLILPFTIVILVLMSLMGLAIIASTQQEIVMIGESRMTLDSFNTAESSAMVAILLSRILLRPELGKPEDILKTSPGGYWPLWVDLSDGRFTAEQILADSKSQSVSDRYLGTGWGGDKSFVPHMRILLGDKEVSSVVVNIDTKTIFPSGASIGVGDSYDSSVGTGKYLNIIVSVRGLSPMAVSGNEPNAVTIITSMYREII